ncbi:MAG: winged helix-turn-helix transcriptional regulator [Candidatus Aenigmatarchaeota archaeon]
MKVGRPSKRFETQKKILEALSNSRYPLTLLKISKICSLNWGTAKKYINELISIGKVKVFEINSSKTKKTRLYVINK